MLALALLGLLAPVRAAEFPAPERSTAPITIVYPGEGAVLPAVDGEMVLGSVSEPSGLFQINGQTVTVHKDGAFLAFLPVSPSTFTFNAALKVGTTVYLLQRQVYVTPPLAPLSGKPVAFDKDLPPSPKQDEELRAGDWLLARAKVTLGAKAEFRLGKKGAWQPMREVNPGLGIVEGAYLVRPEDEAAPAPVQYRARLDAGYAQAASPGLVSVSRATPPVASIRGQAPVMVRTGPGEGDLFLALGGTRFVVGGKKGGDTKLLLSGGQVGWVDGKALEYAPAGAQPPRAETETVVLKGGDDMSVVRVGLGDRVPFIVDEASDLSALTVRFHYTFLHTNWIVYDPADDFVDSIDLKQEARDVVAMTIRLKPGRRLWGYWPSFEGNALRLELRHPPKIARKGSPLAGIRVFIDPGHMPSAPGAIGPLGTREMDVNYAIAKEVERLLLKEKAVPLMSRANPADEVGLTDRPRLAVERRADLFVSVHNNFLPDGSNPFHGGPHGFSVFYYHPQSLELARDVYAAYEHDLGGALEGESLRFGDLLVCRLPAMPAILTESAYLTYPEQEHMLLERDFRERLAGSIVDGLRAFMKRQRELAK